MPSREQRGQLPSEARWQAFQAKLAAPSIPGLDGLRAISVFLVVLYHFGFDRVNGALGVEVFFVLSGFLITWLLIREHDRTGDVSFRAFYKRRTLRIFPAFYAYLLLCLAIQVLRDRPIPWAPVLAAVFYVENYYDALFHTDYSLVGHAWSLGIEEQFYVLWPWLYWRFRSDLPELTRVLCWIIGGIWVYRTFLHLGLQVYQGYIYHAFDTRADHLLVGCLLAVLLRRGLLRSSVLGLCARGYAPAITVGLLAWSASAHADFTYRYVVGYAIEPLLIAMIVVQMIHFHEHRVWGLLETAPMRYLGRLSYSIYLYQQITLFTARRLTASYPVWFQLVFAVVVTIVFATLSYYLIEKPFLKLKDRWIVRAPARPQPAVA